MNRGSDVFATLMWGIRRYAWIVALFVIGIGVLIPGLQSRGQSTYEARAQVGPVSEKLLLPNLDPLPRFAESVFTNGSVADAVKLQFPSLRNKDVIPSRVSLVTAQDNPVLTVVARANDPAVAQKMADFASTSFVVELNKYSGSVGRFGVTHNAVASSHAKAKLTAGYLGVVLGLIAGLVAGIGAVALLLVLRRPVVDSAAAEDATGVPMLGRVRVPRGGGDLDPSDLMGIGLLCRRILSTAPRHIYLAGPNTTHLYQVGDAMNEFMAKVRQVRQDSQLDGQSKEAMATPEVVVLDGPSLEQWARVPDDSSMTLLLVREGIPTRKLRNLADEHFTGTPAGVALVTTHRRGRHHDGAAATKTDNARPTPTVKKKRAAKAAAR